MKRTCQITRRGFLQTAAVLATPAIVASSVLGKDGATPPSEKIVMGAIGVGGMGTGNMRNFLGKKEVQFVAVCDVDTGHRNRAKSMVDGKNGNTDCKDYSDFRDMLADRLDLTAICLALPDHWHAIPVIAAARQGIDMYGEKPLARSIREGRAMVDAVHRYGRVWQTGSWQRSGRDFHHAASLVRNGRIGKITHVEVGLPTGRSTGARETEAVPDGFDWNMWLGPAPWRPYCKFGGRGVHFDWRWNMDYSGGQLTDWAGHHIDIAHWGLGFDSTGPVAIEGKGDYPKDGFYNVPINYKFTCRYANGVKLTVSNKFKSGAKWYGEKGWVHVTRGGFSTEPGDLKRATIGPNEIQLTRSTNHHQNFLDCVKSRQLTVTPIETAHRSISVGLLGEIAMLTGRKLHWNPDTEEFRNDPGASALLGRSYREPWTLG